MESGLRIFLLTGLALAASGCSVFGRGEAPAGNAGASEPVISPEVQRREIKAPDIDTENFEVGAYVGMISVEDFGTATLYGARARYHVTESVFVEGTYGKSDRLGLTSAEELAGYTSLLGSDRKYEYYDLSVGYKLFPGETFIGRNHAFNSSLYFIAGAGQTSLGPDDHFTLTLGAGYQVLVTDWLALDVGVRDHLFDMELVTGTEKSTHNIELTVGFNFFF